jgi:hypothetical protein
MRLRHLLPVLALVAAPAFAQEAHFGLQAGLSLPMADLKAKDQADAKMGYTLGLNVGLEFNGGHVVRPRLDYTTHDSNYSGLKITNTAFGVDYNYFVGGKAAQGFFVIGGLGYAKTKVEFSTMNESKSALALAVGGGFQFTPLIGMDLRYTTTKPTFDGTSEAFKNDALNLGVTFRF